ncbi:RNA-binding protein [Porphyromonadaceae bacterium OttesenSCG-928-L07]|nr:RNA-binding protein [Porphyromonadaceae bacterium OttesenSCG-928-L07]MDL2251541.1 RNA-binding protein [Odoribacter sp. OttesenSCG-928-J03]MDL2331087.1 RNA-binding protein [Odoribacter sp. OttesenSCG-928-A06]
MNIFIARMSSTTTAKDLSALFGEYGIVSSAKIIFDRETGNSKNFGFVEMANEMEGMKAINALNETEFQGKIIIVKLAHSDNKDADRRNYSAPLRENERRVYSGLD